MKHLIDLELRLHRNEYRHKELSLCNLLHKNFYEIGYSGSVYRYDDAIAWLSSEGQPAAAIWSQDFRCEQIDKGVMLLLYHSAEIAEDGSLKRHAKRSSIWQFESGNWQLRFHQATPTQVFEQLLNTPDVAQAPLEG
jgi:hypothetical protein